MFASDFWDWVKVLGLSSLLNEGFHASLSFNGLNR